VPPHALGPDVTVTAQVVDSSGPAIVRTVKTNSSGAYTLDLLAVSATYYVVAQPVVGQATPRTIDRRPWSALA
jgi:septal ring-binding cell division protein DamX